jgi:hypothetical protein
MVEIAIDPNTDDVFDDVMQQLIYFEYDQMNLRNPKHVIGLQNLKYHQHYIFRRLSRVEWQNFFHQLKKEFFSVHVDAFSWDETESMISEIFPHSGFVIKRRLYHDNSNHGEPLHNVCIFQVIKNPFNEENCKAALEDSSSDEVYHFDTEELIK